MKKKITAVILCMVMAFGAAAPSFAAPILAEKQDNANIQNDKKSEETRREADKKQVKTPQNKEPLTEATTERQADKNAPKADEKKGDRAEKTENFSREPLSETTTETFKDSGASEKKDRDKDGERHEPPTLKEGETYPDFDREHDKPDYDDDDRDHDKPDFDDDDRDHDKPDYDDDDRDHDKSDFDRDDREFGKPDFDCNEKAPKAETDFDDREIKDVKDNDAPPFEDVEKDSWYYKYVDKAYKKGYITGKSEKHFAPKDNVTGAELIVMLFRAEGHTLGPVLAEKRWYQNAVDWAWENEILTNELKAFNPDAPVTREEVMYILCRYLIFKGNDVKSDNDLREFGDRGQIADYAVSSAGVLADEGIVSGSGGKLNPKDNLTRAEGAVMLVKTLEKVLGEE